MDVEEVQHPNHYHCPPTDLAGNPRILDDWCTPDTGNGTSPLIDMGAYAHVPTTGDGDCDADLDLADVLSFSDCFTEPGGPAEPRCEPYDTDADTDVDLADLVVIQALFTGSQ